MAEPEHTPDGRYVVVEGRRWRATDPAIPEERRAEPDPHPDGLAPRGTAHEGLRRGGPLPRRRAGRQGRPGRARTAAVVGPERCRAPSTVGGRRTGAGGLSALTWTSVPRWSDGQRHPDLPHRRP
ncbi:hypothetical protein [Nocardioides convexus]|uniref:hypothetical protein n=1 Tax=Nocardioides convexus TaxID=2712224 RepID=UPI0024185B59|nr:hypothetical protein [Nocardioides convexus]